MSNKGFVDKIMVDKINQIGKIKPEQAKRVLAKFNKDEKQNIISAVVGQDYGWQKEIKKGVISVFVPVYNVVDYLPRCVESLKRQTYKNLEIIFVDDGSTDGSREYLEKAVSEFSNAKLIKHEANKNLFLTRISAMKECTGEYFICLDSDDWVDDNYYETLQHALVKAGADVCVGDVLCEDRFIIYEHLTNTTPEIIDDKGIEYIVNYKKNKFHALWNKLFKREVLISAMPDIIEASVNADGINIYEDTLMLTILLYHTNKIAQIGGSQYHYCVRAGQSSDMHDKEKLVMQIRSVDKAVERILNFLAKKNLTQKYKNNYMEMLGLTLKFFQYKAKVNGFRNDVDINTKIENLKQKYNLK